MKPILPGRNKRAVAIEPGATVRFTVLDNATNVAIRYNPAKVRKHRRMVAGLRPLVSAERQGD